MSLASEEISVMNSTQHSIKRSRASLAKVWPVEGGRISVIIFWTVASRMLAVHSTESIAMNKIGMYLLEAIDRHLLRSVSLWTKSSLTL